MHARARPAAAPRHIRTTCRRPPYPNATSRPWQPRRPRRSSGPIGREEAVPVDLVGARKSQVGPAVVDRLADRGADEPAGREAQLVPQQRIFAAAYAATEMERGE